VRFASSFLGILVLVSLFLAGVSAAGSDPRQICIGPANGNPGTRVVVPIPLDDGDGVAGFQVDFDYDPDILTFVGARLGVDTEAAGNWAVLNAHQSADRVRVLGVSGAGVGLNPGFKEMALVDFDVTAAGAVANVPFPLMNCVVSDELGLGIPCGICLQPGIDVAVPRFGTILADESLAFQPDPVLIESGDWVTWQNVDPIASHTTTSGAPCTPDGLWDGSLMPGGRFGRKFPEPPGTIPYFCTPHCTSGHDGNVVITDPILLAISESSGILNLSWSGGGGSYHVFRSPNPNFAGLDQQEFVPDGGETGTTLVDNPSVAVGEAIFYLVINKF
jgi:plastocyanin